MMWQSPALPNGTTRTKHDTIMKTLAANHPIKITLGRYLIENSAEAWQRFAFACTSRGLDPELVFERYCH